MRTLFRFSIACAISGILFGITGLIKASKSGNEEDILLFSLVFIPPLMQLIYSLRTGSWLHLRPYKNSRSLDDFMMNELNESEIVVANNFWMKSCAVICSLILLLQMILVVTNLAYFLNSMIEFGIDSELRWMAASFLLIFFTAMPTIIYNLRTFNISRVKQVSA